MNARLISCATAIVLSSGFAQAQLLVGNDDFGVGATNAWNVNPSNAAANPLWGDANPEVWGMAYDGSTSTVFVADGSQLYGGVLGGGNPGFVSDISFNGSNIAIVGLAWDGDALYGSRNVSNEGIYRINTATGVSELVLDYDDALFDFGGLAYNPDDGLFYGTNDDTDGFGRGLYSLDVNGDGGINFIAAYPAGRTDIDGLAIGDGVAYLVEDEAGNTIHPYDFGDGGYSPSILNPMTSSEIFSGAAWVPTPAGVCLIALGTLASARRRR